MRATLPMFLTTLILVVLQREVSGKAPPYSWADICAGLVAIVILAWASSPRREGVGLVERLGFQAGKMLRRSPPKETVR